jgi:hypothetical protein
MAPENQGGLNYNINIGGDWESKLSAFEARLGALDAKSKKVSGTSGGSASNPLAGQDVVARKLVALENQLTILNSQRVSLKQAEVNLTKKLEALTRASSTADEKALAILRQQEAFEKERVRSAQRLNKELTQAADARQRETAALLKQDMIKRSKETMQQAKATEKNAEALRKSAEYNDINLQAEKRLLSSARELAIKRAQITQLTKDGSMSERAAAERVGVTSAQAKQLGLNMWDAEHAARQFLFTFRRLVGILAVFTLARQFAQAIGQGVGEMVRFNAQMETAKTGIASIISSVGRVYNQQGQLVTGAQAFTFALQTSDDVIKQIRKDAIGSIATFESLVQAFQVAVGPGLTAGLDVKQIRVVSKRLAEASLMMGIPINQLSEEIRSLLQGTATAKNTRIAALFGGAKEANDAIRNAKQQGNLYEVLTKKLEGVAMGTDAARRNFDVLASDLKDSVQLLLAEGGIDFFDSLKVSIDNLKKSLVAVDSKGDIIGVSPQALAIVKEFALTLTTIVQDFQKFSGVNEQVSLLQSLLVSISGIVRALSPLFFTALSTLVLAVNMVLGPVSTLLNALGNIQTFLKNTTAGSFFLNAFKYATATAIALSLWVKFLKQALLIAGLKGLTGGFKNIAKASRVVSAGLAMAGSSVSGLAKAGLVLRVLFSKTNIWVAALSAVATVIGLIGSKLGWWAKLSAKISGDTADQKTEQEKVLGVLTSSIEEVQKGAKSSIEWADAVKDLERELKKSKGLKGLSDQAQELGDILQTALLELDKGTSFWQNQADEAKISSKAIQAEIAQLQADLATLAATEPLSLGTAPSRMLLQKGMPKGTDPFDTSRFVQQAMESQLKLSKNSVQTLTVDLQKLNEQLISKPSEDIAKAIEEKKAKLLSLTVQQAELEKTIVEYQQKQRASLELQIQIFNERNPEAIRLLTTQGMSLEQNQKILQIATQTMNAEKAAVINAQAALEVEKASMLLAKEKRKTALETLQGDLADAQRLGATKTVKSLEFEINRLKKENEILSRSEENILAHNTQELQKQVKLLEGNLPAALAKGLEDFIRDVPSIGTAISESVRDGLNGVAEAFGATFREYLATGKDVSAFFYQALGDVFLDLAQQFATNVAKQMIAKLAGEQIMNFLGMGAANAPLIAATTANTAAITGLTAAMGGNVAATSTNVAATTGNVAATTANTGSIWAHAGTMLTHAGTMIAHAGTMVAHGIAVTFNTLATLANSAMLAVASALQMVAATIGSFGSLLVVAAVTAQTIILGSLLITIVGLLVMSNVWLASILFATVATGFFNKGGLVPKAFAKGGSVAPKGYALGGGIPRPANVPASDTVPAWLTPGEYVLPVPLVKQLGVGFLEKLRRGAIAPSTFHDTASYLKTSSAGVRSFATGGAVAGGGTSAAVSSSDRSVNVAFFDDRKAMDKWAETTQGETAILRVMRKNAHRFK